MVTTSATELHATVHAGISLQESDDRSLTATSPTETLTRVTAKDVSFVDVFIYKGTPGLLSLTAAALEANPPPPGWIKATLAVTQQVDGSATVSPFTLGNLDFGGKYTIVSVAVGVDPNTSNLALLADANLTRSAAQLDLPVSTSQQNLDPAFFPFVHGVSLTGVEQLPTITTLPVKLSHLRYNGFVRGLGVQVDEGTLVNPTTGPTLH